MKKLLSLLFMRIISALCSTVFADVAGYTIDNFHVEMTLHTNGSMDVRETIDVNFTEPRHGIYREIPIVDAAGEYIHISSLTAYGVPIAANTITNGNYTLKIGDAHATIIGPKRYEISYRVMNAIKRYYPNSTHATQAGRDELLWNVVGSQWKTPIKKTLFSVHIDNFIPTKANTVAGAGDIGSGNLFVGMGFSGNSVAGAVTQQILPGQAATIGIKLPENYALIDQDYEKLFATPPTTNGSGNIGTAYRTATPSLSTVIQWLFTLVGVFLFGRSYWKKHNKASPRKSKKSLTIQYLPPTSVPPPHAFWFWYNMENPKIFAALLYYRGTRGRAHIITKQEKIWGGLRNVVRYHVVETQLRPADTTPIDDKVLQDFFGAYDNRLDDVVIDMHVTPQLLLMFSSLRSDANMQTLMTKGFRGTKLTQAGEDLYEQLRGFKEYLSKVERPVIEQQLKEDPNYINKILPWAVLFGVETKLIPLIEDLLQPATQSRYTSYNGLPLNIATMNTFQSTMVSSITNLRTRGDRSSSAFGGGMGVAGDILSIAIKAVGKGGGGGGGGSW